jgi:hypothetical protein
VGMARRILSRECIYVNNISSDWLLCVNIEYISNILQTYSFEEILELNDLTEEDTLLYLVEQEFLELPEPEPL